MRPLFLLLLAGISFQSAFTAVVNKNIYINADSLTLIDGKVIPYLAYNETAVYNERSAIITIDAGDSLILTIVNQHSLTHRLKVRGHLSPYAEVLPGDTAILRLEFNQAGLYIYHDTLDFPENTYMGLAGMIIVKDHGHPYFTWNIREHQYSYNFDIANGVTVDWDQYDPEYFTVNTLSNPEIDKDPSSRITGKVGDTIIIYLANTGQSIHSIHFHGYHVRIKAASAGTKYTGRIKDTVPLHAMGTVVLELVPDKPGIYPLHNHNLVAVTGNKVYPNGMFTTMKIDP